ncbi:hypothetical protein D4S03_00815 [bacterium]|nr:MAG: hypothetical protein D4S03_00815 [bacterium]
MPAVRAGLEYVADRRRYWLDGRLDHRYGIYTCGIDDNLAGLGACGEFSPVLRNRSYYKLTGGYSVSEN